MGLQLIHTPGSHLELRHRGQALLRYVYIPDLAPVESPRPYFHPLYTPGGTMVSICRPPDHAWHTGLTLAIADICGQNFWGGPSYVRGRGYVQLENNGRIQHDGWAEIRCTGEQAVLDERLRWITAAGAVWLDEERTMAIDGSAAAEGYWALDFATRLRNVHTAPLIFGSPTTQGRPQAGYGGLFWRGPRSFQGGSIVAGNGGDGPAAMGQAAPWLAFVGQDNARIHSATLLFLDHPANPRYPTQWFVRNDPYACVCCAFAFDAECVLDPGAVLVLRYRIIVADGAWSRARSAAYADGWRAQAALAAPG